MNIDLQDPNYTPRRFLQSLIVSLNLKNDAALSRRLGVAPPVISKIRNRRLPIGASILISAHEESGLSIKELKLLIQSNRLKGSQS